MACDSLYVAWLKAHYPYELYVTMLKIYDEKKNKDKIAQIISEAKKFMGIEITPGTFGQDNRDWLVNKETKQISQSLSSIRYMSKQAAEELFKLGSSDTAEMGVTYTKAVYTPEAKSIINKLSKQLKPLQKKAEEYLANGGDEFDPEFLELYDKGMPLEQELNRIQADANSYLFKAEEVHTFAKLDCFTNVLRAIQMNTHIDTRQLEILISLDYFKQFGKSGKLMRVYNEFFNGEKKLTKTIKSYEERLEYMREFERSLEDVDLPADLRLRNEYENIGLCLSVIPTAPNLLYFVQNVDDKYSIKVKLYNLRRGVIGEIRIAKKDYVPLAVGSCIMIEKFRKCAKYTYRNGQKTTVPGEQECWVSKYKVMQKGEVA